MTSQKQISETERHVPLDELLSDLKLAIEKAEHKPGNWASALSAMGAITEAGGGDLRIETLLSGTPECCWANFSYKRDSWLAIAAVNALPRLIAELEHLKAGGDRCDEHGIN